MHLDWKLNWFLLNSLKWRENNKRHPLRNFLILERLSGWFLCRFISSHNFSSQLMFCKSQIFLSHSSQFNIPSRYLKQDAQCSSSIVFPTGIFSLILHKVIIWDKNRSWNQDISATSFSLPQDAYFFSEKEIRCICWEQTTSILCYLLQPPYHLNS